MKSYKVSYIEDWKGNETLHEYYFLNLSTAKSFIERRGKQIEIHKKDWDYGIIEHEAKIEVINIREE